MHAAEVRRIGNAPDIKIQVRHAEEADGAAANEGQVRQQGLQGQSHQPLELDRLQPDVHFWSHIQPPQPPCNSFCECIYDGATCYYKEFAAMVTSHDPRPCFLTLKGNFDPGLSISVADLS